MRGAARGIGAATSERRRAPSRRVPARRTEEMTRAGAARRGAATPGRRPAAMTRAAWAGAARRGAATLGRRPGTAAATGARQRSGEEEGGGVGGVESRRARGRSAVGR